MNERSDFAVTQDPSTISEVQRKNMRLISYDVGIKNLAYCLLEYENQQLSIVDWNVLNLLEKEVPNQSCSQMTKPKTKKAEPCQCAKVAKYQKNGQLYCDMHAKRGCSFIIPTKKHTRTHLKKLKVLELKQLLAAHFLSSNETVLRETMIERLAAFYEKQCLEPIMKKKAESAGDTDLILIGRRMKHLLNENPLTPTITHVMIENQISPIATRMKTLQGMLTQYYIDRSDTIDISFVSSLHKLKQFGSPESSSKLESKEKEKTTYQDHKKSGIEYCSQILEKNPRLSSWSSKLDTKKKDDLADCFLQGLWFFKKKNLISYSDDLQIVPNI